MSLAIFDLDDTLIDGNSPSLWSQYLAELGWVDRDFLRQEHALAERYSRLEANLAEYFSFCLQPLVGRTEAEVTHLAEPFVENVIEPLIHSEGMRCIAAHRSAGDRIVIASATPRFLVTAIAERLGIQEVIATDLAEMHGYYTGQLSGIACAREGKVTRVQQWCEEQACTLENAHFYSDSYNDLPLLAHVPHPHAVNPDERLREHAEQYGWAIHSWR